MKLKSKVKGAMTYPLSVLVIAVGVVAVLLLKVIPVFQKMFEGMDRSCPARHSSWWMPAMPPRVTGT